MDLRPKFEDTPRSVALNTPHDWVRAAAAVAVCIAAFECSHLMSVAAVSPRWHDSRFLLTRAAPAAPAAETVPARTLL